MRSVKDSNGAILISTLWIVTILSALCVSAAHRSAITLKLSSYKLDKIKSIYLAKAGIAKALSLKIHESDKELSHTIDTFSQAWSNTPEIFKQKNLGDGSFTIGYSLPEEEKSFLHEQSDFLYGLSDESSRIDINKVSSEMFSELLKLCDVDDDIALETGYCITDWRDEDDVIAQDSASGRLLGAEDEYYQGLETPYACKNDDFDVIDELL